MAQYTEVDYKREYAKLEQEAIEIEKKYNRWFMQTKMAIQNYNNLITEHNLTDRFPLVDDSDNSIANINVDDIRALYDQTVLLRDELSERIEVSLGLKKEYQAPQVEEQVVSQPTTPQEPVKMAPPVELHNLWQDGAGFDFGFEAQEEANPFAE